MVSTISSLAEIFSQAASSMFNPTTESVANAASAAASSDGLLTTLGPYAIGAGSFALGSFAALNCYQYLKPSQKPASIPNSSYAPFQLETADSVTQTVFQSWSPGDQRRYREAASSFVSSFIKRNFSKQRWDGYNAHEQKLLGVVLGAGDATWKRPWAFAEHMSAAVDAVHGVLDSMEARGV